MGAEHGLGWRRRRPAGGWSCDAGWRPRRGPDAVLFHPLADSDPTPHGLGDVAPRRQKQLRKPPEGVKWMVLTVDCPPISEQRQ